MKRTQLYLTEEEHEQLDRMAEQTGQSKDWLIREAVGEYIVKKKQPIDLKQILAEVAGAFSDRDVEEFRTIRNEFNRIDHLWKRDGS